MIGMRALLAVRSAVSTEWSTTLEVAKRAGVSRAYAAGVLRLLAAERVVTRQPWHYNPEAKIRRQHRWRST
jgi:DNA-binding IscR family transcriptional regulator